MVKSEDFDLVCPLCCEEFDISDREFYPCKCGYQVCMWCWHRIRESETGLCPACRTPYGEDPHQFSAVDVEEVLKANKEKEAAAKREKQNQLAVKEETIQPNITDLNNALSMDVPKDRSQLANMRVIRRNLIYAVGLPPAIATEEILRKPEYFGQYGKIAKIVINRSNATPASAAEARRASASAYVTFQHKEDTLACILALDGFYLENRNIRASYGTSKYCSAFIKNVRCNNPECTYLHEMGAAEDTFTKQEIQAGYVTSGRDVLARQQQILAEQIRVAHLAAGGSSNVTHTLPRKRVGGGGPSGTGKAAASPAFPPPEFDEPAKPAAAPVPPPPAAASVTRASTTSSQSAAAGAASSTIPPTTIAAKIGRAVSTGTATRSTSISSGAVPTASATNTQRKPQNAGLPSTTTAAAVVAGTAAAVVAGGRKEGIDTQQQQHSTLTALTPLKRTNIAKSVSTGCTKAITVPRSTSLSPSRSADADEKMPALPLVQNGKKSESIRNTTITQAVPTTERFAESVSTIGGDIIGQVPGKPIVNPSGAVGIGGLDRKTDPVIVGPLQGFHAASSGVGSLGGVPIQMPDTRSTATSLSSALGGEIFNGPLSSDYQHKAAIGSSNDKWNSSSIGGSPLAQLGGSAAASTQLGRSGLGGSGNNLWVGSSTSSSTGVIGGQRFGGGNSTSALASILGVNLPTGSGSLQETSSLWTSSFQQPLAPSPISSLNSSSLNSQTSSLKMGMIGEISDTNNTFNNNGGSLIGGIPIGGAHATNYGAPGTIGGGSSKSDIALLQSLLPGVHITSDSSNPLMGFNSNSAGWGFSSGYQQQSLGSGAGGIGGDPIRSGNNWAGNNLNGHHSSTIGAVGQHSSSQNQRQAGAGIW